MGDPRPVDGDRACGPYVVVGASGILAPLGRVLSAHGVHTVGVSRGDRLGGGEWDERVALDTHDVGAVTDWLVGRETPFGALIGYDPAVAADCWPLLARVAARVVVVATSGWANPGRPPDPGPSCPRPWWSSSGGRSAPAAVAGTPRTRCPPPWHSRWPTAPPRAPSCWARCGRGRPGHAEPGTGRGVAAARRANRSSQCRTTRLTSQTRKDWISLTETACFSSALNYVNGYPAPGP